MKHIVTSRNETYLINSITNYFILYLSSFKIHWNLISITSSARFLFSIQPSLSLQKPI